MKVRTLGLFLFLLLLTHISTAQEYHYDHFTVKDGLVQMQVTSLFQDSKGYLWIGTKLGVSRFDGINFTNFTIKDGLPAPLVSTISEDSSGRILMLTRSGLAIYDNQGLKAFPTDHFLHINKQFGPVVKDKDSIFIYCTNLGNELLGYYFNGKDYVLKETYFPKSNIPNDIFNEFYQLSICYDEVRNILYVGSGELGLNAIEKGRITKIADVKNAVHAIKKGKDDNIYIWYDGAFATITNHEVKPVSDKNINGSGIYLNDFVVDAKGAIFSIGAMNERLSTLKNNIVYSEDIGNLFISTLLVDREDNLWIGTEKGLLRNTSRAILNFIPGRGGINEMVWSVAEDKNDNLIFASYNLGLQSYKNNTFSQIDSYHHLFNKHPDYNFYMGSLRASDGNVYFPVSERTIIRFDGTKFHDVIPDTISSAALITYEDPDDKTIFIGTINGLYRVNDGETRHWNVKPGNGKSRTISGLVKDKQGRIWMGGFSGISILQNNNIIHLPSSEMPFTYGGNALLRDSIDNIWIGNLHGLFHYDNNKFVQIDHPALESVVVALAMAGDSTLMIGTSSQLLLMDLKAFYKSGTINITIVGPDKGYHALEPGQNGFYRDSKGFYWLTNSDMTVRINPGEIRKNKVAPVIYLKTVALMDDRVSWNILDISRLNSGKFKYSEGENNLRFDFIGISLRDPQGVTYSHFLEGFDKGWYDPSNESVAVYTNLRPGKYTLYFKAANTDGVWSPENSYSFEIEPALYQKLWFRILSLLIAAALLVLAGASITAYRRKKHIEHNEMEKKIAQFQLLSIKNQIDPHFTYNALNSIAAAVIKEERELAYRYFVKLSRLMRSILKSSEKLTRSIEEELAFAKDFIEIQKFRFNNRFDYTVDIQEGIDLNREIPIMTMQTFVENAIKHGLYTIEKEGLITISIKERENFLIIKIEDNGIGREKAKEMDSYSTGKGLLILSGYFEYFNRYNEGKIHWETADLKTPDGLPRGTAVTIFIPEKFSFNL